MFKNKNLVQTKNQVFKTGQPFYRPYNQQLVRLRYFYAGDPGLGLNENWNLAFGNYSLNVIQAFLIQ